MAKKKDSKVQDMSTIKLVPHKGNSYNGGGTPEQTQMNKPVDKKKKKK